MARRPKPWFRKGRGWFVTVDGKQVSLGSEKELAYKRFYELMREPKRPPVSRVSPLVSALLDDFLEWTRKHRAAGTFHTYQQRLQWFLDSLPNCLVAAELKPHHVQSWLDSHPDWSDTTKRGCVIAVQRAFRWSEKMGYIEASPLAHFEKPSATSRDQLISEPEYQAILEMARDEPFRDLLTVHWETGCRPQESLRVEAKHVDLRNARWVFPPQEAKGKRRPRIVYLNDPALAITTKWLLRSPDGPIFRNTSGNHWTPYAVNCRPMGTRCGDVDPGVILYLVEQYKLGPRELERLLYHESGLLGVSQISSDLRPLLASSDPRAAEAVELFVYRVGRELGSLTAALGGLDALVFTGGIGENSATIRWRVCRDAAWLGLDVDEAANAQGGPRLSRPASRVSAWVIPANEELMIARHTRRLLHAVNMQQERQP